MNKDIAIELIKDTGGNIEKLSELILWAYEKGWAERMEEIKEELSPADEQEFLKTR